MIEKPQTERPPLAVVILAAGLGTRMKSDDPKVLHEVCGRPMLSYVIDAALSVAPERIVVVTGPDQEAIAEIMPVGCERAVQQEVASRGGLHALHPARPANGRQPLALRVVADRDRFTQRAHGRKGRRGVKPLVRTVQWKLDRVQRRTSDL